VEYRKASRIAAASGWIQSAAAWSRRFVCLDGLDRRGTITIAIDVPSSTTGFVASWRADGKTQKFLPKRLEADPAGTVDALEQQRSTRAMPHAEGFYSRIS
jgi:hypothetical protein